MAGVDVAPNSFTTFGELLKFLRQRARMSQRQLGIAVGYSETHITRLESNERQPDAATVSARFVDTLDLAHQHDLAHRLDELAAQTAGQGASEAVLPATPTFWRVVSA